MNAAQFEEAMTMGNAISARLVSVRHKLDALEDALDALEETTLLGETA